MYQNTFVKNELKKIVKTVVCSVKIRNVFLLVISRNLQKICIHIYNHFERRNEQKGYIRRKKNEGTILNNLLHFFVFFFFW